MTRTLARLLPLLLLALPLSAQEEAGPPAPGGETTRDPSPETAVRLSLHHFWDAILRADPTALRASVAFPLMLLEPGDDEEPADRYLILPEDWPAFARSFPPQPLPLDAVRFELQQISLQWFGDTCVAIYDLVGEVEGDRVQGRFYSLLVDADGWRVTVAALPR